MFKKVRKTEKVQVDCLLVLKCVVILGVTRSPGNLPVIISITNLTQFARAVYPSQWR